VCQFGEASRFQKVRMMNRDLLGDLANQMGKKKTVQMAL